MQIEWLLNNAAPVMRFRTQTKLTNAYDNHALQNAIAEMLELPQTLGKFD